MEDKELCKLFLDADKIINGEIEGNLTMEQMINDPKFNEYCPKSKCETDLQINGFSEYLFNKLGTEIKEEYYEYIMMWLSDKLFEIVKGEGKAQSKDITLNEAYDKYLKKNIKNGSYWILLDIKKGLKEVNLMHMKQFYKLLNHICNAIVYYNPNGDDIEKFINKSSDCSNQYSSLYDSVPKCDSYLHLLDDLKKTYESFKNSVHDKIKNEYPDLVGRLQTLTTIENTSSYFVEKFKEFDFSDEKCKLETKKTGELSHKNGSENSKSKPKDSENSKGNTGDTPDNKGNSNIENRSPGGGKDSGGGAPGSGANDGSSDEPKTPMDQATTHSSGASDGYLLNFWRIRLSPMNYIPSIPDIYETPKNILASTANKITTAYSNTVDNIKYAYDETVDSVTNAYNNTMIVVKDTYNSTMTNITNAYTVSRNYIGDAVNSLTDQLNTFNTSSQFSGNQPGSYSSGGGADTSNHLQQNPPPSSPQSMPPSTTQSTQQSVQQLSQTPLSSQPQDPSPSKPHSNQTQDKLQITVQNGASSTLQQPVPNTGAGEVQTLPITQVTLSSSSTGPSITGSGITTGIVVKMNEKLSIWCIAQNKKCNILGIGIISISIFAFLAIMYKYLPFKSGKNSKRKKRMKKVINSIGGKIPVQIIIKSYDRTKDLKPIINSVDIKKDPLLNIYKLMQADPIPFINLFFLLIFFVYKRKYDFLEL